MVESLEPVRTSGAVLRRAAERWPEQTALRHDVGSFTFRDVQEQAFAYLGELQALGLEREDRLLIMMEDRPEYVFCWLGASLGGIVEVPVNVHYKGTMLRHIIEDSGATTIITTAAFVDEIVAARCERLETILLVGSDPAGSSGVSGLRAFVPGGRRGVLPDEPILESDPVALMYTSGTTGPSKGAVVTHRHAYEYAAAVRDLCEVTREDVYYSTLPLFHVAGQWAVVYAGFQVGATAVIAGTFSAGRYWEDSHAVGATVGFLLGAMAQFLYNQEPSDLDGGTTMERLLVAPLIADTDGFRRRFDVQVTTCYASTECGVPIVGDSSVREPTAVGRARDGYCLRIVDEFDEEVPIGQVGELVVRPDEPWRTFREYNGRPEATVEAMRNGWLHTGDAMRRDDAGYYYFVDRIKDTIRRRGENISSFEVEREVRAFGGIVDCAAVGVPSPHTEDDLVVYVVPERPDSFDPDALHRFLREKAPRFMVPDHVIGVTELPMTPTGKIQKAVLRQRGVPT